MEHEYTTVTWDGEHYIYLCKCGHTVITKDGMMPIGVKIVL